MPACPAYNIVVRSAVSRFPMRQTERIDGQPSAACDVVTFGDSLPWPSAVEGSPKECFPCLVDFVSAVAYHFCLNLPRAFLQPGKHSFGDSCTVYTPPWSL